MASNASGGRDDERNPFVAFRRFADEQFSSVLHGLADIPSAFGDLRKRLEERESDAHKAWQRFNASYERATSPERRQTEQDSEEKSAVQGVASLSPSKDVRPRMDELGDASWMGWQTEPWPSMMAAFHGVGHQQSWRPSLHYLFHNRYSPLILESDYPQQENKWRQAFEDLLLIERGEDVPQVKEHKHKARNEGAAEWLGRLAGRNLVRQGPFGAMMPRVDELLQSPEDVFGRWPSAAFPSFRPVVRDVKQRDPNFVPDEPNTELQLYEHFLGRQSEPSADYVPRPGIDESNTPSIVATMTTTERRMAPDGSIITKTMLKKRFADGSEESEETTNTTHAPKKKDQLAPPTPEEAQTMTDEQPVGVAAAREQSDKRNWFWSSSG